MLDKCKDVCRTYDAIQYAYADILSDCSDIVEFRCNVFLEGLEEGEYTTDFVCTKQGGDLMVSILCIKVAALAAKPKEKQKELSQDEKNMRWALNKFLIPENVAVGLLIKNSFISDLQQETICRYNDKIKKNALMCREEVEQFLPEIIVNKKMYFMD